MQTSKFIPVLTLDGPSGVGKGTVAMRLARELGWHLLDSGAIYRVLGHAARRQKVDLADENSLTQLARCLDLRFEVAKREELIRVRLDGEEVGEAIRAETAGEAASRVAALPAVREALLERQRAFRQPPGLVADGRDMGTVVFDDATCKIFLTASQEERANRRHKQLMEKGINVNLTGLVKEITARDHRDANRAVSPLKPAEDARVIDTTHLTIVEVVDQVRQALVASLPDGLARFSSGIED